MKAFTVRVLASLAMISLLAACAAVSTAAKPPGLNGTAWVLSSLPGQSPVAEGSPTLRFEGGSVQGTDGCNRYTAPYTATGSTLQVGPKGASTQMACPPEVMKQAQAFMGALTQARTYRIASGQLQLLTADGTVLATFAAQSQTLAGTSWSVTGYNNGRQAVVSVLTGTNLTMAFGSDGQVGGSAGCNRYSAAYTLEGHKLTIGPAAATRMMCAKPEGVMEQERQFLRALETVAAARFEGDRLELRGAEGQLAITLTKVSGG